MKRIISIFILVAVLFAIVGCGNKTGAPEGNGGEPQPVSEVVFAMDTAMILRAYGDAAPAAIAACKTEILRLDELFSTTAERSDVRRINDAGGEFVEVDAETLAVVELALDYAALTGGAFDPTVYGLVRLYGFTTESYRVPEESELALALESVGYANIEISGSSVRVLNGAKIDLGGIAKGYLADRLKQIMEDCGVASAVLSLGGNVISVGNKPSGEVWNIGVTDPANPVAECLALKTGLSVVTSGSYQRYFYGDDGKRYHHIIDPKTGLPANNGLLSVSVVCENSAKADALSTALFVMGPEAAAAFWRERGGFDMILIDSENRVLATPGAYNDIEMLTSGYELGEIT